MTWSFAWFSSNILFTQTHVVWLANIARFILLWRYNYLINSSTIIHQKTATMWKHTLSIMERRHLQLIRGSWRWAPCREHKRIHKSNGDKLKNNIIASLMTTSCSFYVDGNIWILWKVALFAFVGRVIKAKSRAKIE